MNPSDELREIIKLPAKKIVCAVSGGVDSMLLLMRAALHPFPVAAAHVNYGKRAEASDADEVLVTQTCRALGIPCFVYQAGSEELSGNFQHSARILRYRFFEEVRKTTKSDVIITAHHAGDERESMLMQLFRKGNLQAVRGIFAEKNSVLRPMLGLNRTDILRLAQCYGIQWRDDESNYSTDYSRNRIRHEVIPVLDDLYPGWDERLQREAAHNRRADDLIRGILGLISCGNEIKLSALNTLSSEICREVLISWIFSQTGFHPASGVADALNGLRFRQKGRRIEAGKGFEVVREEDSLLLQKSSRAESGTESFRVEQMDAAPAPAALISLNGLQLELQAGAWTGKPQLGALELKREALVFPLEIRTWQHGDRMRPLGMKGHKLVSDILTDHKLPNSQKNQAHILQSFDGKTAAVIFPAELNGKIGVIADHAACTSVNDKTIIIKLIS